MLRLELRSHVRGATQPDVGAGSLKFSKDVLELHGGTNEIVAEYLGGLIALSPVRAAFPGAHGRTTGGGGRDILEIEEGGLSEEEGSKARARRRVDKLGLGDGVEGYFHFKAVPGGVDEPGETIPQLAEVGNEVMFTDLGGYPTPSSDGKICTRNDRNGCVAGQ